MLCNFEGRRKILKNCKSKGGDSKSIPKGKEHSEKGIEEKEMNWKSYVLMHVLVEQDQIANFKKANQKTLNIILNLEKKTLDHFYS